MNLEKRFNELINKNFYISECSVSMTTKQIFNNTTTLKNHIKDNLNKSFLCVDFINFYNTIKENKKEFDSLKFIVYNMNLYIEFENFKIDKRYILKSIDKKNHLIENNTICKYSMEYIWDFLKDLKIKDIKEFESINISFNTDGLLFLDYREVLILAPRIENN